MKRTLLTLIALIVFAFAAMPVFAKDFYVGAGIGNTFFSAESGDALDEVGKIDENSTAWKIFGGWRNNKFIGIEGGYRDFGKVDATVGDYKFESKTTGWDIEALGRFEIAIVQVFGKAGVMFWSSDGNTNDDSGTDFFWGLGAGVALGPIGVRLEWESVEISKVDNMSMVSLGATFGF